MVMPIALRCHTNHRRNYCRQCRMAPHCLPGNLHKKQLKQSTHLEFEYRTLKPGETLCRQGDVHDHIFALRTGALKSSVVKENGEEFVMRFHLAPAVFGWEATDHTQKSFEITAIDYSNICIVPINKMSLLSGELPAFDRQLLTLFNQRVQLHNQEALRTSAEQRVASFLAQLKIKFKNTGFSHRKFTLPMTHQDLANYLRITPETISRTFKQLEIKGAIKVKRKKVTLINEELLHQLAEHDTEVSSAAYPAPQ